MKEFLIQLLKDPLTEEKLFYDPSQNILATADAQVTYTILQEVPILLPKNKESSIPDLHKNLSGSFDYVDHYQKDAEVNDYFKKEDSYATQNEIKRLHQAIINAVPKSADLILDAGCGNGWLANYFTKQNRKVISTDISTVNPVKALNENQHENHAAFVADVFHLPIKNNSLDCIVASEIIEHVYDPALFITRLLKKLNPGGKLIITAPYNEKIEYYLCVHCNLPTPKNAHLHSFNKKNIKKIIPQNVQWTSKTFANKYLIRARINVLLSFLPFGLWKLIDKTSNIIFNSPTRFIIQIIKS